MGIVWVFLPRPVKRRGHQLVNAVIALGVAAFPFVIRNQPVPSLSFIRYRIVP